MYRRTTNPVSVLLILTVFAATTFLLPSSADARWIDHSDEYPGSDGPSLGTVVALGAVACLAIGGVILMSKKNKQDKLAPESEVTETEETESVTDEETESEADTAGSASTSGFSAPMLGEQQPSQLGLYLNIDPLSNDNGFRGKGIDLSDVTLKAGITFCF